MHLAPDRAYSGNGASREILGEDLGCPVSVTVE
jgi:hypothetical protein